MNTNSTPTDIQQQKQPTPQQTLEYYTDDLIKSFKTCQSIKKHEQSINSIDFSPDGTKILTSSSDDSISIFDITRKEISRHLINKTQGCGFAIFTHNPKAILCAGKHDFRIMYWCLHSNEILFSFKGHSNLIIDLSMNPNNDLFLSTSNDGTSRLWNLHTKQCICIFQDSQCASFDNSGVIASVTSTLNKLNDTYENFINLYDMDKINKGPFDVLGLHTNKNIKQVKFSNDGKFIVCLTETELWIVDAFVCKTFGNVDLSDETVNNFDISPDSRYVAVCCESGNINVYDKNGKFITCLEFHTKNCNVVKFGKEFAFIASACNNLVIWIPSKKGKKEIYK